ncbi:Uncharacterised protein [Bordetella ansorpii]|uniref:Uncharacterized protein n=1 Tax=Bordetella ansorpii TaxID=288768 RepID=A0A157SE23_9BORD|nr:Uncharacterised protein [Bordetella ansorpii]
MSRQTRPTRERNVRSDLFIRLNCRACAYRPITVLKLAARSSPPPLAAATVAASNSSTPASPRRVRQRVKLDASIGGSVCK